MSEHLIGRPFPRSVPRRTSVADFALSAITLGWLYVVRPPNVTDVLRSGPGWLGTGQWIQPTDGAAASDDVVSLASEINRWVGVSLAVAALITAAMAGSELVRLVRRLRSDLAPSKSS